MYHCGAGNRYRGMREPRCSDGHGCVQCWRIWTAAEVRRALESAANIAARPYSDEVQAYGGDEPQRVGSKIANAILNLRTPPEGTQDTGERDDG